MISIVHLLFYAMMYLTRIAGIETRNHEYSNRYPRMYLTRVAGMLLRLPCKAVRNRKTLRQFVGAVIDRPRPTVKHNLTGNPSGE